MEPKIATDSFIVVDQKVMDFKLATGIVLTIAAGLFGPS